MARVDPFVIPLPRKLARDTELGPYFAYTQRFLHDLWQRTGAGTDLVDGAVTTSQLTDAITAHTISADNTTGAELTAAIASHEAASDPHPGYTTAAELSAAISAALVGYLTAAGPIHLTGIISPSILTGNVDNYNPTGLATATVLRLSSDASRNVTGIVAQSSGRVLELHNVGGFDIVLLNDVTSTNLNRFLFGADVTLATQEGIQIWYDTLSGRWRSSGKHV
jgi:hypothetical protein